MKKILLFICLINVNLLSSSLEVGLGGLKFNYNEYTDDGNWFNSEKNSGYELNGGFVKYRHDLGIVREEDITYYQNLEIYYSFHLNTTDYDGSLSNGDPYQGKTDNYLHQGHVRYHAINKIENYELGLFLGLGYRYWDRDLLGQYGYLETYQWPYYEVGLSWKWFDGNYFMGASASYQKAYKPTMIAYTKNKTNIGRDLDFDLGDTKGYKIDIPIGYQINNNWDITLHYIYDVWDIQRSNTLATNTGTAYEPSSETTNKYTYLSIEYRF